MIVYHGTTMNSARSIGAHGFRPKSGRVWFTRRKQYAKDRAHNKARAKSDRPFVLTCELDLNQLRRDLGPRGAVQWGHVIIVFGPVPPSVLQNSPCSGLPCTAPETAQWINGILGLQSHNGVSHKDAGVDRVARWIDARLGANPNGKIDARELFALLLQCLPAHFKDAHIDPKRLQVRANVLPEETEKETKDADVSESPDERETAALDCLMSRKPRRRIRGLSLLADVETPDLFEWCILLLEDEANEVRLAALETMKQCDDIDLGLIAPLAESKIQSIRAAAISILALRTAGEASGWYWRGMCDPSTHVRLGTARLLQNLDPNQHRDLFETALYDPEPRIAAIAEELTAGKGFVRLKW